MWLNVRIVTSVLVSVCPLTCELVISSRTSSISLRLSSVCSPLAAMVARSDRILVKLSDIDTVAEDGLSITLSDGSDKLSATVNCSLPSFESLSVKSSTNTHCVESSCWEKTNSLAMEEKSLSVL